MKTKSELKLVKENCYLEELKGRAFSIAGKKKALPGYQLAYKLVGILLDQQGLQRQLVSQLQLTHPQRSQILFLWCESVKNSVYHALSCKKGGHVTFRHDVLVETEAELLREAKCRNVYTEPSLLPTNAEFHPKRTITTVGARLDIIATGL